jgi:Glucosamine-6-phosphate isomerases/6-phosphogluconolactonase
MQLTDLVRKFEEAEEASQDSRSESERARDYYDGRQLTSAEIKALKKRKQPIVIENLIQPKIDYLCGLERQTRTDPRAYPRTAAHEDDATAATDALRYVADDQNLDVKRSMVFQNMLVEGFGGVEVIAHRTKDGIDPKIIGLSWDRIFFDPHSCQHDFSDALYQGFVTWMDAAEAKERWLGNDLIIDQTVIKSTSSVGETYDDKPKWTYWADKARNRVRIVTIYCKKADGWYRSVFTLAGELEPYAPSPWLDDEGKPECGMILQSAYVDRDNDRYGPVRHWISLQDEVNKRRSKFLHLSNSRQVRVSPNVNLKADAIRAEMSRPDGVFIGEVGDVEVIGTGDMAAGHFNLLAEAKQAIQLTGPNATMQGKSGQDQSGRAILALQQGGMTEMAPLLDNLRHFNIRVFRAIWNRIRQFWNEERWVRVTDDEKNVRFVGLNVTQGHMAVMKIKDALKDGEIDQRMAAQFAQQIQMDPAMQQPANAVAQMDVDIQIDETMDSPTLQIEQFEQLAKLAPMAPPQYLPTMFELMIEASNLRNKDKLREITKKLSEPQQDPMQEPMQQLQFADAQATVEEKQSKTALNYAKVEEVSVGAQLDAMQTGVSMSA